MRVEPIVLMTDFGVSDPFVGMMKGVISGISPAARVIDLTHGIRAQDVYHGAFILYRSFRYFPRGSIFCAVVDPGVGTGRWPMAIQTRDYLFVGPDNGLLWPAASDNGIKACICLDRPEFFLERLSATFHGRDIFAPVAAHLSRGISLEKMGSPMEAPHQLILPEPEFQDGRLSLTVLDVDIYGNLTLNIRIPDFASRSDSGFSLHFGRQTVTRQVQAYAEAPDNQPVVLGGSSGFMEIAVKNGSAAAFLGAAVGDRLFLTPAPPD